MVSFRSATHADIDDIAALWASAGVGGGLEVDRAEMTDRLRNDDGFFVVGEIAGGIMAVAMGCYDDHRGWLKRVAISPERQGEGLGRAIIGEVERRFLAAGVTKLRLAVFEDNTRGAAFWESLDYVELPEIRYFTKDLHS